LKIEEDKGFLNVLSFKNKVGIAASIEQGLKIVVGDKVVILGCGLQYDPNRIRPFLEKVEEGYDVVSGRRVNRAYSREAS